MFSWLAMLLFTAPPAEDLLHTVRVGLDSISMAPHASQKRRKSNFLFPHGDLNIEDKKHSICKPIRHYFGLSQLVFIGLQV
jgi:hypothetical protein